MNVTVVMIIIGIVGAIVGIFLFRQNAADINGERKSIMEEAVKKHGGVYQSARRVERNVCSFDEDYTDPDSMYKFYEIQYIKDEHVMVAYGVLIMRHNTYGPAIAYNSTWEFHF